MSEQAPVISRRDRIAGHAALTAIALLALFMSLQLGLWRQNSPGEGLFPFLTALAMIAFGGAGLAQDWMKLEGRQGPAASERARVMRVAAYLGALVFYAVTLEFLGFIVATAITVIFILRFAERYAWRSTLALTAATVLGCQVLFVLWLGAILPFGTLWSSLFE